MSFPEAGFAIMETDFINVSSLSERDALKIL
jgi:hypothetical protein